MSFVCKRRPGDVRMPAPLEVHLASELSVWITKTLCVLNRSLWVCQHYSTCCYVCFLSLVTATKAPPYQPAFARSQTFHSRHCPSDNTTLSQAMLDPPRCHPFLVTTSRTLCGLTLQTLSGVGKLKKQARKLYTCCALRGMHIPATDAVCVRVCVATFRSRFCDHQFHRPWQVVLILVGTCTSLLPQTLSEFGNHHKPPLL